MNPHPVRIFVSLLAAGLLALAAGCSREKAADHDHAHDHGTANPATAAVAAESPPAAWLAAEIARYPLTTCAVSGDDLGGMGPPIEHVYKEAGKPDRLVRFCCDACIEDFTREPAKFLAKIDAAAAAKPATGG